MVGVVVTAVYVELTTYSRTCSTPQLAKVGIGLATRNTLDRIPHHSAHALGLDVTEHFIDIRSRSLVFVCSDVDVRCSVEHSNNFVQYFFQNNLSLCALHIYAHCTDKGFRVSWHIDFRNDVHTAFPSEFLQFLALLLCIVLAGETCHSAGRSQLGISLHFEAPSLIFGHVPVESIHLEAREQVHVLLQRFEFDERTTYVVHITTQFERGPVYDFTTLEVHACRIITFCQLGQGLCRTDHTDFAHRSDLYARSSDFEHIGFVCVTSQFMVVTAGYALYHFHNDITAFRSSVELHVVHTKFLEEANQRRGLTDASHSHTGTCSIFEHAISHRYLLWDRQDVLALSLYRSRQQQACSQEREKLSFHLNKV